MAHKRTTEFNQRIGKLYEKYGFDYSNNELKINDKSIFRSFIQELKSLTIRYYKTIPNDITKFESLIKNHSDMVECTETCISIFHLYIKFRISELEIIENVSDKCIPMITCFTINGLIDLLRMFTKIDIDNIQLLNSIIREIEQKISTATGDQLIKIFKALTVIGIVEDKLIRDIIKNFRAMMSNVKIRLFFRFMLMCDSSKYCDRELIDEFINEIIRRKNGDGKENTQFHLLAIINCGIKIAIRASIFTELVERLFTFLIELRECRHRIKELELIYKNKKRAYMITSGLCNKL